jgi:uncharacterized protein (TIGR03086 family)
MVLWALVAGERSAHNFFMTDSTTTDPKTTDPKTQNDPLLVLVRSAALHAEPILGQCTVDRLHDPTPCTELNVGQLAGHLIGGLRGFADVAAGKEMRFDGDPDLSKGNVRSEFRKAADRMLELFDLAALERTYKMPWGDSQGRQLVGFELIELLTHAWDLARALSIDSILPEDLATAALESAKLWVDDSTRTPVLFGPEVPVPPAAPVTDRLVGFLGRNPAWVPSEVSTS